MEKEKTNDNFLEIVNKLIKKKNIDIMIVMIQITMEQEILKTCLMLIIMKIITNQYQSKVLLKKTINIMKAEVIKTKNYQQNNILM